MEELGLDVELVCGAVAGAGAGAEKEAEASKPGREDTTLEMFLTWLSIVDWVVSILLKLEWRKTLSLRVFFISCMRNSWPSRISVS